MTLGGIDPDHTNFWKNTCCGMEAQETGGQAGVSGYGELCVNFITAIVADRLKSKIEYAVIHATRSLC